MKITLNVQTATKPIIITDEHAASSYGIPVAVVDGQAYGPNDFLPIWPENELSWMKETAKVTVASACLRMQKDGLLCEKDILFIQKFYK